LTPSSLLNSPTIESSLPSSAFINTKAFGICLIEG
jgi:hypothetical protein